jgi:hypothetical protein
MDEGEWTGSAYPLTRPYINGAEVKDPVWEFEDEEGNQVKIPGPRAFRHTLSAVLNGLAQRGFLLLKLFEEPTPEPRADPGSWDHFVSLAPPWLTTWFAYRPDFLT